MTPQHIVGNAEEAQGGTSAGEDDYNSHRLLLFEMLTQARDGMVVSGAAKWKRAVPHGQRLRIIS